MMEPTGRGDVAMNLVGLILLAALSGGIVAVSLRLRTSASSAVMLLDGDRPPEDVGQHNYLPDHSAWGGIGDAV